jgi:molybdopterin molybdotransferase
MSSESTEPHDVRMRGFAQRTPVAEVTSWLRDSLQPLPGETIPSVDAAGRVLVNAVTSEVNVPGFARAMMDGFALRAADTSGASTYSPLALRVVDESLPGQPAAASVCAGQAVRIMTGAPMPAGADAVLPVELVRIESEQILALSETSPGKHVATVGEDISQGVAVLGPGRRLRPQDIGVLASIGVAHADVVRRARVRIVVTGNELLPPGSRPHGTKIVDSNSPMLAVLIQRDGGIVSNPGIVPDDPQQIRAALADDADVILVSGGSSVGQEDHAPRLLAEDGQLTVHGIAMRPSSPTGIGRLGDRWVFLLPGNPVSCLCAYDFFAGPAIRLLGGRRWDWPYRSCRRKLRRKIASVIGRVDYARVQLIDDAIEPLAISGASMLSSTTRADGFVIVPQDSEGYAEGTEVELFLYDS